MRRKAKKEESVNKDTKIEVIKVMKII